MFDNLKKFLLRAGKANDNKVEPRKQKQNDELNRKHSPLESFLKYYKGLSAPGYAVLVIGEWGSGKTFQVKNLLTEEESVYVSLFGVTSVDQLHADVFAASFPKRAKITGALRRSEEAAGQAGGMASIASILPGILASQIKRSFDPSRILIFDDLERSAIPQKAILGAINYYVEQVGVRVIVIAHDEKMAATFRQVQEKIFGQTIRINPDFTAAFRHFLSEVDGKKAEATIEAFQENFSSIFSQSSIGSLRILRRGLHSVGRLVELLDDDIFENKKVVEAIVEQYFVYVIEVAAGRLSSEDLFGRRMARQAFYIRRAADEGNQRPVPPIVQTFDRYPTIELDDDLFDDKILSNAIIGGNLTAHEVNAMLRSSHYLAKPTEMKSWRIIMMLDELGAKVAEMGFMRVTRELSEFKIVESGDILHTVALQMMLASKGAIDKSVDAVQLDSLRYIDELASRKLLKPAEAGFRWTRDFDDGHDGYGYWLEDQYRDRFRSVFDYLINARKKVLEEMFPEIADQLLALTCSPEVPSL